MDTNTNPLDHITQLATEKKNNGDARSDATAPAVLSAEAEMERTKVLGYNHARRSPQEIAEDLERRQRHPRRWRRRLRYTLRGRLMTSMRARFFCLWGTAIMAAISALGLLWWLGEIVAGVILASATMGSGIALCLVLEILLRCPDMSRGLLKNLGILQPAFIEDPNESDAYVYEVFDGEGRHLIPDADAEWIDLEDENGDSGTVIDVTLDPNKAPLGYDPREPCFDPADNYDDTGIKHQWGDTPEQVHRPAAQLERLGQRVMQKLGAMVSTSMPPPIYDMDVDGLADDEAGGDSDPVPEPIPTATTELSQDDDDDDDDDDDGGSYPA